MQKLTGLLAAVAGLVGIAMACSSSDDTSSGGGSSGDCSCRVSINGDAKTIPCGESACVGGRTQSCGEGAALTQGAACASSGSSGTSGGSGTSGTSETSGASGSATSCSLFTCTKTADCGGIAPCFSTSEGGKSYCYEQEGNADLCSKGTHAITKTTSNGPTTICVPEACPEPDAFLQ